MVETIGYLITSPNKIDQDRQPIYTSLFIHQIHKKQCFTWPPILSPTKCQNWSLDLVSALFPIHFIAKRQRHHHFLLLHITVDSTTKRTICFVSFVFYFFIYIFMLSFLAFRFVFFFFKLNKDKQVNLCIWFNGGVAAAHRIERNNEMYTTYITYTIKPKWKPYIEKSSLRPPPKIQNAHSFSPFCIRCFWLFSSGRSVGPPVSHGIALFFFFLFLLFNGILC